MLKNRETVSGVVCGLILFLNLSKYQFLEFFNFFKTRLQYHLNMHQNHKLAVR